jgi:uncharacterized protein (TIGR02646 family)
MIKLNRCVKPVELTPSVQKQLTDEFKATGKSVWNQDYIKKSLSSYSNDKCCYCEADISEESKYMEVEHFHHKDLYKDEVLEWENLLPSCKRCNGTKNDHDTKLEPIIKPTDDNPKNHLKFWRYRFKGIDELGKTTVSVLNLNDQDRLVKKRFEIGNAIQERLEELIELADDFINGVQTSTRRKNRIINSTKKLMQEGLPDTIYACTSATIILTDPEYDILKSKLQRLSFWDKKLENLEIELNKIALDLQR